jgi:predicted DNA-binding protein (MmcQ/YjbR family)
MKRETLLKKMRALCESLPGTSEGSHFGSIAFKAGTRLFATYREESDDAVLVVGLEPEHAAALLDADPRFTPYPRDRRAVVIHGSRIKSWDEIHPLVLESYGLATPGKKKGGATNGKRSAAARTGRSRVR